MQPYTMQRDITKITVSLGTKISLLIMKIYDIRLIKNKHVQYKDDEQSACN